eukprot:scaffold3595_cov235-Ochromonas_danica.AAC.32
MSMFNWWAVISLLFYSVCGVYEPAEWCRSQPSFVVQAARECFVSNSSWDADVEMRAAQRMVLNYIAKRDFRVANGTVGPFIYIHTVVLDYEVGGLLILDKLLQAIRDAGLDRFAVTHVVAYGNLTHVPYVLSQYQSDIHFIPELSSLMKFNEFPTLALMQAHAQRLPAQAKLLYLHTKGVTAIQDQARSYARDVMISYNILLYPQAVFVLNKGYDCTGTMANFAGQYPLFVGNFFWMTARRLQKTVNVTDLVWWWRYAAEKWPLSNGEQCRVFSPPFDFNQYLTKLKQGIPIRRLSGLRISLASVSPPSCPLSSSSHQSSPV